MVKEEEDNQPENPPNVFVNEKANQYTSPKAKIKLVSTVSFYFFFFNDLFIWPHHVVGDLSSPTKD